MPGRTVHLSLEKTEKPEVGIKPGEPLRFHTPGVGWKYQDGTRYRIGPDGAARRVSPKAKGSKKQRRRERRKNGGR